MSEFDHKDDEITRRQWILRLGEIAALAGISGLVPGTVFVDAQQEDANLPPGLYTPSADDLVHALSSAHRSHPPVGSETDYAQPSASPFQPQFLSLDEYRVVTRAVEIVLGGVDPTALAQATQWIDLWLYSSQGVREMARHLNPLHRSLAVAYFGEKAVTDLERQDPAVVVRKGVAAWNAWSVEKHGNVFLDLGAADQTDVMKAIASLPPDSLLRESWEIIRSEAIRGYYTSAQGLKELDYKGNSYYPECPGCPGLMEKTGDAEP